MLRNTVEIMVKFQDIENKKRVFPGWEPRIPDSFRIKNPNPGNVWSGHSPALECAPWLIVGPSLDRFPFNTGVSEVTHDICSTFDAQLFFSYI